MKRHLIGSSFALATLGIATPALGQFCQISGPAGTCSVNATMSLTAPVLLRLTVSSATTSFTVTEANYDAGFALTTGPTVTAKANQAWRVQISSSATLWTATNTVPGTPARANKPLSDLLWSTTSGSGYALLSGTGVNLASGTATSGTTTSLFFKTAWSYLVDTPGAYSIPVTITIISP